LVPRTSQWIALLKIVLTNIQHSVGARLLACPGDSAMQLFDVGRLDRVDL
jgi:hypothetical protein